MAEEPKKKKIEINSAKSSYLKGQRLSNMTEAIAIGYTPMILIIFNFLIALSSAAYVSWLLPSLPHGFWKIAIFAIGGSVAAMYLPSRMAFMGQCIGHLTRVKGNQDIRPEFKSRVIGKIRGEISRNLFLSIMAIIIMILVHATLIFLMIEAFSDPMLMRSLNIQGGETSYIVIGVGIELVSMFIDVFLGLTTQLRVDVERFYPDLDEDLAIIQRSEQYEVFQTELKAVKDALAKYTNPAPAGNPAGSNNGSGAGNQGGNAGGGKPNKKGFIPPNRIATPPTDLSVVTSVPLLLKELFKDTDFQEQNYLNTVQRCNPTIFNQEFSPLQSKIVQNIRNLTKKGAGLGAGWDSPAGDAIHLEINKNKTELVEALKKIGLHINSK